MVMGMIIKTFGSYCHQFARVWFEKTYYRSVPRASSEYRAYWSLDKEMLYSGPLNYVGQK